MMAISRHNEAATRHFRDIAHMLRKRPSLWTQNFYARDDDLHMANPTSSRATAWCTMGFLELVAPGQPELRGYMADTLFHMVGGSVPAWNDEPCRSVSEVIDLFEAAASRCAEKRIAIPNWQKIAQPLVTFESVIERIEAEAA